MRRSLFAFALAAVLMVAMSAISGCGTSAPQGPAAAGGPAVRSATVIISEGAAAMGTAAYGANPLVVSQGTMVTWINYDTTLHTVTSSTGIWNSGPLAQGQSFSYTFNTVGTFSYYCTIHGAQNMSGAVRVQ